MENLGGHCLETILETLGGIEHDRPVAIIAYTVKGWGTPLAGHKDNHAGLMTAAQMEAFQASMNIRGGHEWDHFEGLATPPADLVAFLKQVPFSGPMRRHAAKTVPVPQIVLPAHRAIATQTAFGKILNDIAASGSALADRIVTTSPDVTVSTNLGPWVNRRNLFSRTEIADTFHEQRVPSAQKWRFSPDGQHIELGIAEMNLFLLLGAAGLSHSLFGERLLPIGTLYDPFIARGLDALNYACYQDARFMLVATPSGVSLAPEGGAHQSVGSPLIGMSQDGIAAFEPAFADELAAIMEWAFAYMISRSTANACRQCRAVRPSCLHAFMPSWPCLHRHAFTDCRTLKPEPVGTVTRGRAELSFDLACRIAQRLDDLLHIGVAVFVYAAVRQIAELADGVERKLRAPLGQPHELVAFIVALCHRSLTLF